VKLRSLLPALLLVGIPLELAAQSNPPSEKSKLTQKIIPVADLVSPIPDFDTASCTAASGGATSHVKGMRRLDEELVRLVQSTVAPSSWTDNGGRGTIDYYPLGQALVVNNSPEVIEQLTQFLDSMREPQHHEVVVEVRLINLSRETFDKMSHASFCADGRRKEAVAQWFQHRCVAIGEEEVGKLLTDVQIDRQTKVLMTPKCTIFNGQKASIRIDNEQMNVAWKMQPRISADRRFTALSLTLEVDHNAHETVLCVPAGGYCLIGGLFTNRTEFGPPVLSKIPYLNRLVKNVGYSNQHWVALVKVTPICVSEEYKMKGISGAATDASKAAPIASEEVASIPTSVARRDELLKNYVDACSRGDLRLIKKYHRELRKYAVEKESAMQPSERPNDTSGRRVMVRVAEQDWAPHQVEWLEQAMLPWQLPDSDERMRSRIASARSSCGPHETVLLWEVRWLGRLRESVFDCPLPPAQTSEVGCSRCPADEHAAWNHRWLSDVVELRTPVIEAEEEAGWAKPGPKKIQGVGVDQK
jgi:hypothetical protein